MLQQKLQYTHATPDIFSQPTVAVARALLGHALVHIIGKQRIVGGRIVETEAYTSNDPASHSFRGKTRRNASMFMTSGTIYVYRIYGIHLCMNIATEASGIGAAVLIRALEPLWGIDFMQKQRKILTQSLLCCGPGRLTQALAIDLSHDGTPCVVEPPTATSTLPPQTIGEVANAEILPTLLQKQGSVLLLRSATPQHNKIACSQRIGVHESTPLPYRFFLKDNKCISRLK